MGVAPKDKEEKTRKKPGRVPTSCAECRRLKLRCDKNVPCGKCVARGCGSICPDGQLTSGKGNRLVLANTEELHDRIEFLCARIRELEDALRILQETVSDRPHPLLRTDLLILKNGSPLTRDVNTNTSIPSPGSAGVVSGDSPDPNNSRTEDESFIDAFGTLTIGLNGESSFLGQTARSEYLFRAMAKIAPTPTVLPQRLSPRILELSSPDSEEFDEDIEREIVEHLPVLSEAMRLCNTYLEHGTYLPMTLQRSELIDEVMNSVYRAGSAETARNHHSLSLLFIVFAIATILDPTIHPYSIEAQEYYHLSRAALTLTPPERVTTCAAIQVQIHMAQYVDLSDWEGSSPNASWLHIGTAVRLAHGIGLHLDSARWNLSEETSERRNRLLWQLFSQDTWLSFSLGRPPSMSTNYIDCSYPKEEPGSDPKEISYSLWTCKYSVLMHSVMTTAFGCKIPAYNTVLDLDRKVRDFYVPVYLRPNCAPEPSLSPYLLMQRYLTLTTKETTLMSLHRAYFAQALQDKPDDLANHRYIPSVMATYRSAWRLIRGLVINWRDVPTVLSRVGAAWSPALSAAIVMCILVTRAPGSKMTQSALEELDALDRLFQDASATCRFAANLLQPILILARKAHQAVDVTSAPLYQGCDVTPADLDRLGGRTHLVSAASPASSADSPPSPPSPQTPSPPTYHRSPSSLLTDALGMTSSSSEAMHPTIAQDMRSFDLGEPSQFYDTFPDTNMAGIQFTGDSIFSVQPAGTYGFSSPAPGYQNPSAAAFGGAAPMLDATWQSFVEQLGF
ncbi:fungal-specific transcription factor domain-containing protein [Mycena alexandri]|uniref:Fungal-specific transcription factor domain-containing protein n=1 Tax=Mycena alexandri TaxID=1745969 RepID=A0AAD6XAG3_9AGAR|nr:fungal-specific transcription factor domain-containing protein [Mycena alexandri]